MIEILLTGTLSLNLNKKRIKCRSACLSVQSDLHLYYLLIIITKLATSKISMHVLWELCSIT